MTIKLTTKEAKLLLTISDKLSRTLNQHELRLSVGEDLLRILRADFLASYIWNPQCRVFEQGISINMDPKNLARYDEFFQFRDPITFALQKRRRATLVCQVMPQKELEQTEFFNDFLMRDGLHHGINLYAYDGKLNIGDLRVWRTKRRPNFGRREIDLLELVKPHFRNALRNARVHRGVRDKRGPLRNYWERSPFACFVFDNRRNLIHQNQACAQMERELPGHQFSQLMARVMQASRGNLSEDSWGPFNLSVFRPESSRDEKPHMVVHVQRGALPKLDSRWLHAQYGLSRRESEIALLLAKGLTDNEVAGILSITYHTVRAHLKSIFYKMDVTNRTELLHAMMNGLVDITID